MPEPIDNDARIRAVSELDKNLVVIAGAGTGKTTLLVDRMLHQILGHKRFSCEESPVLKMVAMTFTEKAAGDMKVRLMEELEKIVSVISGVALPEEGEKVDRFLSLIRETYQISHHEIERRAKRSLEDMDKAQIGTIHSFATSILRLYPIESGVSPGFCVDKGDFFDEFFEKEWARWLDAELSLTSPRAEEWKGALRRSDLVSIKELAKRLSGFAIPLDSLQSVGSSGTEPGGTAFVNGLCEPYIRDILSLIHACKKPDNNLLFQLKELLKVFETIKIQGIAGLNTISYDIGGRVSSAKTGWDDLADYRAAQALVSECHDFLKKLKTVDEGFIETVVRLVIPFARGFRQAYLSQGYIPFDGLLTLTRDLLKNPAHRYVRERLKREFRSLLVDEFQDTDPVQYEIVLFLSESEGYYSEDARSVVLEPGKLFIVGDPKQSIYSFRRADIEACEFVVKQICKQEDILKLQENFRSHSGIIDVINELFDGRIMIEQAGLQPPYIPIYSSRQKKHPSQKVELVMVSGKDGEELQADEARIAEAEWIARWITTHVNNETIRKTQRKQGSGQMAYKDIAILLRAFTKVRPYLEALKRYGVPYIVEGEKYFYTTQEILDFVNLLCAIENPYDAIAMVGILRSPLVGLTDREIYQLQVHGLLDYRIPIPDAIEFKCIVDGFYRLLKELHTLANRLPVSRLIARIMDSNHIAEITAASWHGEQKLANYWKLYQMAYDMEQSEGVSLKTFIYRIKTRIHEVREEGESPLSDETMDVVKILTIHKSKGLEFPVVILGNLHGELKKDISLNTAVFDWATSKTGIVVSKRNQQIRNLHSIFIEKKLGDRLREEEKRVLYVAMTRAKERLILAGSLKDNDRSYMGMIVQTIKDITGIQIENEQVTQFPMGNTEVSIEHFRFDGIHRPSRPVSPNILDIDWAAFVRQWKEREEVMAETAKNQLFISPSAMSTGGILREDAPLAEDSRNIQENTRSYYPAMIGTICHYVLERWDFQWSAEKLNGAVESALKRVFVGLSGSSFTGSMHNTAVSPVREGENASSVFNPVKGMEPGIMEFLKAETINILSAFIGSEVYNELRNADILGREIPVLLPWKGQIVRGIIDVLYKSGDRIIIADYKTGHLQTTDVASLLPENGTSGKVPLVDRYRCQKEVYCEAVKRSMKIENPEFKLIFLRAGKTLLL